MCQLRSKAGAQQLYVAALEAEAAVKEMQARPK
jgi:hypothetical protein